MAAYVYILAARPFGPIYVGATTDLRQRVEQHRAGGVNAHTRRYAIHRLVYFEAHVTLQDALLRERRVKRWKRVWKDELIAQVNPEWDDLAGQIRL